MQLDRDDIKAVANSRVTRVEKKNMMMWAGIAFGLVLLGLYVAKPLNTILMVAGAGAFLYYYMYVLDKKQKKARAELLAQWDAEQVR